MENASAYFEKIIDEAIQSVLDAQEINTRLDLFEKNAGKINQAAQQVGDICFEKLEKKDHSIENYIGTFIFPEKVKSFLILWRDIIFEQQKAELLRKEEVISAVDLKALNEASNSTLFEAGDFFKGFFKNEKKRIERGKGAEEKAIENWKLQSNPWGIYKEQIGELSTQCKKLREDQKTLKKVVEIFETIEDITKSTISDCLESIGHWEDKAEMVIASITEACDIESSPLKIAGIAEEASNEVIIFDRLAVLVNSVEQYTSEMPEKMKVPMSTSGGMIRYREVSFRGLVRQWLDAEVTPLMYEAWELTENSGNSLKMALINILNRSVLLNSRLKENMTAEIEANDLNQPLNSFLKKVGPFKENIRELQKILNHRFKTQLKLSEIYNMQEDFLPIPLESTMRRYRVDRNRVVTVFQRWWEENLKFIRDWINKIEREDALSTSEKVVRFVQSRIGDGDNGLYRNIFQTTGYIGESFWVGRKDELSRIEELIGNWKLGFRGSVALTGNRFSGKSLFGELVANRFFSMKTVRLHPNSIVKFAGRTFETTHDLGAALSFIKKYANGTRTLIWLDNLELWQNRNTPLNQNVRKLKKAMGGGSSDIFYLISMAGWLKKHLSRFHNLESMFQAEINLDRMSLEEVREAILIRHGATHKMLVNEKSNQEVSSQKFFNLTRQVYNSAQGNIGEALGRWSNSIRKIDDEKVLFYQKESFPFPDFINSESGLLLSSIMLAKRINEYDLRKIFGPAFNEKYSSTLQQLINIGLLERLGDGKLQIRDVAVNEVARLLESKKFL